MSFRYLGYSVADGVLTCRYSADGREFAERFTFGSSSRWDTGAVRAAARLVFLLAGVSYYKTAAPAVIDLGDLALTGMERSFLREFYLQGLGEFAYRNGLDLSGLRIEPPHAPSDPAAPPAPAAPPDPAAPSAAPTPTPRGVDDPLTPSSGVDGPPTPGNPGRPRILVPFGGGIDSIVTVEAVRQRADVALFVVNRPGDRYDAIEQAAAVSGLDVIHVEREIDPQLLRSRELGFLNGHIPVTGIISAVAVLAALLDDRTAVIMSNEWSASVPTLVTADGSPVNHQYSKSYSFEAGFRAVLGQAGQRMPEYFSLLRPRTELWVGREFAALPKYHATFRSCNKAFFTDKRLRLDHWCGQCDKCAFIDLILAPFLPAAELDRIFLVAGEPLADAGQADRFRGLLGTLPDSKPFECVGEVTECRAAVLLAARRKDRAGNKLLQELAAEVAALPDAPTAAAADELLRPVGEHFIPAAFAAGDLLYQ